MRNTRKKKDEDLDDKTTTTKDLIFGALANFWKLASKV